LAVLTTIFTTQQAQQMAGRAALLPADTATPDVSPTVPAWTNQYATYRQTELHVFVGAMDNLFLITAVLAALAALGALLLRSGPVPAAPLGSTPPQPAGSSPASGNGSPTRPAGERVVAETSTEPRDT
jgi:hypothetical protein